MNQQYLVSYYTCICLFIIILISIVKYKFSFGSKLD